MVRYLKYIIIIFGGLGLLVGSFFYLQNKNDIQRAWSFSHRIDYEYLKKMCQPAKMVYICLEQEFGEFAEQASLTGMGIGMKMAFNVMDRQQAEMGTSNFNKFSHSIYYLRLNNLALKHVYKNYFGFKSFYPGFIGSLPRFYQKGFEFSENIINGLEGPEGLQVLESSEEVKSLRRKLEQAKTEYFHTKSQVNDFIEKETNRLK